MRRARESFQGPRRDRRRVQGDRPGPDRGPQVHGMGSVHALVRRGLAARGMALRRLHDRRIRPAGSLRSDFPRVHDHVHPVGPDRLHCRGQRCVVRLPAPTGVRFAGEQVALRLLPLFWLRLGRRERLHRRDLDVVCLQSHARVAGCVPYAGWRADQLLPRSIDPFDLLSARAVRHGRPSGDTISELGIHRGPRRIGSLCVVHRPEGFRLRTALGVAADATHLGFGLCAYLIILFATISTNAGNIYASALGITNIATRWKMSMRRLLLVSSAIVVPLAILPLFETNFVFTYIFFLDFLGAIVVPLWTLTLVDYFLVKARRYTDDLFASEGGHYWYRGGWNWPAFVTLLGRTG